MSLILMSSLLLGVATLILQVSTSKGGNITLWIQPNPALMGDTVFLCCKYKSDNYNKTTFFRDGNEIGTWSSTSEKHTNMTITNVTEEEAGVYTCASQNRTLQSPEVRFSVKLNQGNITSTDGTAAPSSGYWTWIIVSCSLVLLILIPSTVWLVGYCRGFQTFNTQSCWSLFKKEAPAVALPATRQDVTEVQWELSWMEMSSLMDKHLYPGT